MAKKPTKDEAFEPDVEQDMDLAVKEVVAEPAQVFSPSDEVLMTYNLNEATWLAATNPEAFARWQALQNPEPRRRPRPNIPPAAVAPAEDAPAEDAAP